LLVFAAGVAVAADDPAAECANAVERKDYDAAVAPCTKAAEQGFAEAQYNLGWMYRNGRGVPGNDAKAVEWYTKAAEQGYAKAQHNLGSMYYRGEGVPEDDAKAVEWFTLAAEQGDADAQVSLGVMYVTGKGAPKNNVRAFMWWIIAAAQGNESAEKNKDHLRKQMTQEQIAEAQELASEWSEKFKAKQDGD